MLVANSWESFEGQDVFIFCKATLLLSDVELIAKYLKGCTSIFAPVMNINMHFTLVYFTQITDFY